MIRLLSIIKVILSDQQGIKQNSEISCNRMHKWNLELAQLRANASLRYCIYKFDA